MSVVQQLPTLVVRQLASAALSTAAAASTTAAAEAAAETQPSCVADNEYNGRIGVRISAIFVILIGSLFGMVIGCKNIYHEADKSQKVLHSQSSPTDTEASVFQNGHSSSQNTLDLESSSQPLSSM